MNEIDPKIGFCSLCGVVVSRYHADNQSEFHASKS